VDKGQPLFEPLEARLLLDGAEATAGAVNPGPSVFLPADITCDGNVDFQDYQVARDSFGLASGATRYAGDIDGDGDTDHLDYLALKAGYGGHLSGTMFATPLADAYVIDPNGRGLTIGIDGYDGDGDALTITAVSDNPDLHVFMPTGNRYARLHFVDGDSGMPLGRIEAQLLEGRAPTATDRFITLATNHVDTDGTLDPDGVPYYTDVPVHRIIDDFMIQSGDATNGNGTGGSGLGAFPDLFDPVLSYYGRGAVGMANAGPNTNNSQFFITEWAETSLDQKHMIFGQVISGWDVLQAISEVVTDDGDRPVDMPLLAHVEIFTSDQDATITLTAGSALTGEAHVTITLDDGQGNVAEKVITITPEPELGRLPAIAPVTPPQVAVFPGQIYSYITSIRDDLSPEVDRWVETNNPGADGYVTFDPATNQLLVSVPDDTDIPVFTATFHAREAGYDNRKPAWKSLTVFPRGATPVIDQIDAMLLASGGSGQVIVSVTDDGPLDRGIDMSVSADHPDVQVSVDQTTREVTVVAPTGVTGMFTVTVAAAEAGFTDIPPGTETFRVLVSGPTDPPAIGHADTGGDGEALAVDVLNGRMYVADKAAGLEIFDVSGPGSAVRLGGFPVLDEAWDVAVFETTIGGGPATVAFVADMTGGVAVLDVTDPDAITLIDALPVSAFALRLVLDGNHLYVCDLQGGVRIFDVSDVEDIQLTDVVSEVFPGFYIQAALACVVENDRAYLIDGGGGFLIFDVTDPADVIYVEDSITGTSGVPWDGVVQNGRLYTVDQIDGLVVWDVTGPDAPTKLGTPYSVPALGWMRMDISGNLLAVSQSDGFLLLDVSDPDNITEVYSFTGPAIDPQALPAWEPTLFGSHAALPFGPNGVAILDVTSLLPPVALSAELAAASVAGPVVATGDARTPDPSEQLLPATVDVPEGSLADEGPSIPGGGAGPTDAYAALSASSPADEETDPAAPTDPPDGLLDVLSPALVPGPLDS